MSDYQDYGFYTAEAAHTHEYLRGPILGFLAPGEKKRCILDLGCGNGALVNFLIDNGYDAYGTDASEEGIRIAKELHPERFALQDLSSQHLPQQLAQHSFNTILATEVIEHLYDPRKFIAFCKTILQQNGGGEVILSTPYHGYLKNLLLGFAGKWDSHMSPLWDGGHIKLWSKQTLTQLLEEGGFTVTAFAGCGRVPYLWKSMIVRAELK